MTAKTLIHAFSGDALSTDDAVGLAQRLKKGEVSEQELVEAAINRIEAINPAINAMQIKAYEFGRASAQQGKSGFFAGIPSLIKDNVDIPGFPTQNGTNAYEAHNATKWDPYISSHFKPQGFNVLGKTTLPEFGLLPTCEPTFKDPTRNPWHTDYSSGASSAGAAALVASGAVPVAHANDGGGSIRIPAACCGLVGLKPSRGRHVYNGQAGKLPVKIVGDGIVSRTMRDTAYFQHQAEIHSPSKAFEAIGLVEGPSEKKLRIGLFLDSPTGYRTDITVRNSVLKVAAQLEKLGHEVIDIGSPISQEFVEEFVTYWGAMCFSLHRLGRIAITPKFQASKLDNFTKGLSNTFLRRGFQLPGMLKRLEGRYAIQLNDFYQRHGIDVILSPVLSHTTIRIGHLDGNLPFDVLYDRLKAYGGFTPLSNALGTASMSVPAGISDTGLPLSVMLETLPGGERTLLELGYAIEAEMPWQRIDQVANASTKKV